MEDNIIMEEEMQAVPQGQPEGPATGQSETPSVELQKQADTYLTGLSEVIHGKKTRQSIMDMLGSGPPEKMVPATAMEVNAVMEDSIKTKGQKPNLDILFAAIQFTVGDLIEVGNAAGIFQLTEKGPVSQILQSTMQKYIEKGLTDGSIDIVELQEKAEAAMPKDVRAQMLGQGKAAGFPAKANEETALAVHGQQQYKAGMLKGGGRK